jgi:hypothetical protein
MVVAIIAMIDVEGLERVRGRDRSDVVGGGGFAGIFAARARHQQSK